MTKLDRKQERNVFYQVWVLQADRKKPRWPPQPLKAYTFSTSSMKPLNGIFPNLTGSKNSTFLTKFVFLGQSEKRWHLQSLIVCDIFDFFSEITQQNLTKFNKKQQLNVLFQACVSVPIGKNKMAVPASYWMRHFRLLLMKPLNGIDETWQEGKTERLLPRLWFSGRLEKQDSYPSLRNLMKFDKTWHEGITEHSLSVYRSDRKKKQDACLGLWLAKTFSTSSLKLRCWKPPGHYLCTP